MKTRLLIMHPELVVGGAERVLINLVNRLDREKFTITLLLRNKGCWDNLIPGDINVLYMGDENPNSKGGIFARIYKYGMIFAPNINYRWSKIKNEFDIVISFHEPMMWYLKCFNAYTISWVHTDYSVLKYEPEVKQLRNKTGFLAQIIAKKRRITLRNIDKIVFVAESARYAFLNKTGIPKEKTDVFYNLNDEKKVLALSNEKITRQEWIKYKGIHLCSVGRIAEQKAFYRLIPLMEQIKRVGIDAKIFLIGDGNERNKLSEMIKNEGLEEDIILLGNDDNPFKYIKASKLLVCTSLFEAYCTVTKESIILETPFVTTSCSGMEEQIGGTNAGMIVENSDYSLADMVIKVITNDKLYSKMKLDIAKRHRDLSDDIALRKIEDMLTTVKNNVY